MRQTPTAIAVLMFAVGCATPPEREATPQPPEPPTPSPTSPERPADAEKPPATKKPVKPIVVLPSFEKPSPGPGETPEQTYAAAKTCVARADYMGVWGLFSKKARGEADGSLPPAIGEWRYFNREGFIKLFGMDPLEFEKMPIPVQYALLALRNHRANPAGAKRFSESEMVSVNIADETAEVEYRTADGETYNLKLLLEDGVWKLARTRL